MAEPLKDLIDHDLVDQLIGHIARLDPKADLTGIRAVMDQLDPLELKDRVNLVADALAGSLSGTVPDQLETIVGLSQTELSGLRAWPLCSFIERHCDAVPARALDAMEIVTRAFSCEFALRPFLTRNFESTMARVMTWTRSDDEHVRRLASEGTRPRLPWGPAVPAIRTDPTAGLVVLERLRHDPSEYVRRSVANHLNDMAKTHPATVTDTTRRWMAEPGTDQTMVSHALRSLVKAGDPAALSVLGFTTDPQIEIEEFGVEPESVTLGDSIEFRATIVSTAPTTQRLVVDFVVHHVLANGSAAPKVFKWKTVDLAAHATATITKQRKIATATTRRYYPGLHLVQLQISGQVVAETAFSVPVGSSTAENRPY